jgi:voltage-gated potassium channel Kch
MRLSARTSIVLVAAIAAFVLGYLGYRAVPGGAYSPTDAVYWSISQFYGRIGPTPGGTPWQLDIGRFLALAVIAFAASVAIAAIMRDRIEAWTVRRFARNHAIVVGSGPGAMVAVEALRAAGNKVVVTDIDPRSREGLGLRDAGARVVPGDAIEASTAAATRLADAKLVIVITGDDQRNVEVLEAASAALLPGPRYGPVFHVAVDDVDVWRELSQAAFARHVGVAIEFFNPADRAALALLAAAAELTGDYVPSSVLIDGAGPVAIRIVVHIVRRAILAGRRAEVLLSAETGDRLGPELRRLEPWCFEVADVQTIDATNSKPELAIVCGASTDAQALVRAAALTRDGAARNVLVAVKRTASAAGLGRAGLTPASLHIVSTGADALAGELIESSAIEILARARHEDYVRRGLERGESRRTNPSLVGWEELPSALKESNRRFAETVGAHVSALGATLRPLAHAPAEGLLVDDLLLEDLARAEHDRWAASLGRDGWRPTSGSKDTAGKLHPLLVPWEDLPEGDREKDREVFRGLSRMLALVGYELVLPATRRDTAMR